MKITCTLETNETKPKIQKPKQQHPSLKDFLLFAYFIEDQIENGVCSYTKLAKQFNKTPTRISQIVRFKYIAPEIQQDILFNNPKVAERRFRTILSEPNWQEQIELWNQLKDAFRKA